MEFSKYYKEQQKVSYDNGQSWQWLDVYRKGDLITTDNWASKESCERGDEPTPDTPEENNKFKFRYETDSNTTNEGKVYFDIYYGAGGIYHQDIAVVLKDNANEIANANIEETYRDTDYSLFRFDNNTTHSLKVFEFLDGWKLNLDLDDQEQQSLFTICWKLQYLQQIIGIDRIAGIENCTQTSSWFYECNELWKIQGIENLVLPNVEKMNDMFINCYNIEDINLHSMTGNSVYNLNNAFYGCTKLLTLDISNLEIDDYPNMGNMFYGCLKLKEIKCKQKFKDLCDKNKDRIEFYDYNKINWIITD